MATSHAIAAGSNGKSWFGGKKKKEIGFIVKGVAKRFCKLTHKSVHFIFINLAKNTMREKKKKNFVGI